MSRAAKSWPRAAATRVAFVRSPVIRQASARATRPPSSGNAGTRLNTSSTTFIATRKLTRRSTTPASPSSRAVSQKPSAPASAMLISVPTTTIPSVTSGPAMATLNSWPGVVVSRDIFITPPKKKRSMPLTSMPSRRQGVPELMQEDRPEEAEHRQHRGDEAERVVVEHVAERPVEPEDEQEQDDEPRGVDADADAEDGREPEGPAAEQGRAILP